MPQGPDSSPSAPPLPPAPANGDEPKPRMKPELKAALLVSSKTRGAILKVARDHKVPRQEREDVLADTIAMGWKARLPAAVDEACKILNQIGKIQSFKKLREVLTPDLARLEAEILAGGEDEELVATDAPQPETRVDLQRVLDEGRARYARFEVYLQAKTNKESAEEVARRLGLSGGYLRNEWLRIDRFLEGRAKSVGLIATMALLILFWRGWRAHEEASGFATYAAHRMPPAALDARALRERAQRAWNDGAWDACVADVDAARQLDPSGHTPEMIDLRQQCDANAHVQDVTNPELYDSKVPLH